jgi:PAS domain S-box-containing protein
MLVVITREGLLKRVNPAFSEMLGYDVADLVGKPFIDFVHPDERAHTLQMFGTTKTGGTIVGSFENRCLRRDGTYRVLSWRGTVDPLTGDGYSVARDITEQRQTEAQLRHAQKMEAVGQLAGGIAHDFNNLVQAVLGNVELALMEGPSSSMQEHLHEISGAALRAAELTKQLLLFSRRQPLHPVVTDLNLLLRGLSKLLRRLLPENISIEVRTGEALASVNADPTQLEQVILNLSVNARDAMENGGSLVIETSNVSFDEHVCESQPWARPGRFVQLTVGDTGAGMTPEVRERVFDPFFTTKSHHRGTGLGLATVYGIIQQHGGFLHVESVVGLGTTFSAYLPADDRAAAQSSPLPIGEAVRSHGQETVLVAEDDEAVRRPVIQLLERAGYRTLAAIHGQDAIRLLAQHRDVDLVVLDVVMPELGGPQAWERMRQMRPDLRVIFASGYADDQYRERLPEGAEVLDKPFRTEVLLAAVRRNLDLRVHSRAHMSTTDVS